MKFPEALHDHGGALRDDDDFAEEVDERDQRTYADHAEHNVAYDRARLHHLPQTRLASRRTRLTKGFEPRPGGLSVREQLDRCSMTV